MSNGDENQRNPKDMKGLLQLCASVSDPNAKPTSVEEMDPEKREFLDQALKDLNVNPVNRMKECIQVIQSSDDVDIKLQALDEIMEWCGQIDFARDFHKIGGFDIINPLLNSESPELRSTCMELIAELVQNNPYCQTAVLEYGLIPHLLERLDKDSDTTVKIKALYAISCLARENLDCQKVFLKEDGFSVLMRAMQTDVDKLKIKASFMMSTMCKNDPSHRDTLCDIGMVEQLVGLLSQEHSQHHEHIMAALLSLLTDHERAKQIASQPQLNLQDFLQQRLTFLKGKEEFLEEYEYAEQILRFLRHEDSDNQEIMR